MRIALIGCGNWGKNIARSLSSLESLAIIVDPAEVAISLAAELGVQHGIDVDAILGDPTISALVIATPAETHAALASKAIAAGKDVYVEKPIALSVVDGQRLGELADASGTILMVGHLLQYHTAYRTLADLAASGALGTVRHIVSNRLNLGMLRSEENVMWSFAPHDISMVLGLVDNINPRVSCIGADFFQPGIHDTTTIQLRFGTDITAEVRSSWFNPEKEQKLIVVGSKAMAVFDDTAPQGEKLKLKPYSIDYSGVRPKAVAGEIEIVAVPTGEPLKLELAHFIECIESRKPPRTDANEANRVLAVLEAAQASLNEGGKWIDVQ